MNDVCNSALDNLQGAFDALSNSVDDTGCTDQLCVVDGRWLDEVDKAIGEVRRLTSAAPELLKACRAANISLSSDEHYQEFKPLIQTLEAAIAKATGQE